MSLPLLRLQKHPGFGRDAFSVLPGRFFAQGRGFGQYNEKILAEGYFFIFFAQKDLKSEIYYTIMKTTEIWLQRF